MHTSLVKAINITACLNKLIAAAYLLKIVFWLSVVVLFQKDQQNQSSL